MCSVFKFVCILHLCFSNIIVNSVKVQNLYESKNNIAFGDSLAIQGNDLHSLGIFEHFLRNLLDLLTKGFPERKLVRYCRILNRHLRDMEFKYTKQLAKHMRYLSRMYREDLKAEIEEYSRELSKNTPMKRNFLDAMNAVFTLREKMLFNDYIFDIKDYGHEDKLYIDNETKKLLSMIVESVYKLSGNDRKELERRLRKAIKEYQRGI